MTFSALRSVAGTARASARAAVDAEPIHAVVNKAVGSKRDHRIDLVRGLALVCIFINHMPGNWLGHFTTRNFGFSDAAEVFVLLAGVAAAFAFFDGRNGVGRAGFVGKAARRSATLYAVHLGSSALAAAMLWMFLQARDGADPDLLGIGPYLVSPVRGTIALLSGQLQFNYFNILPLYVILLVVLPGLLLLAERGLWVLISVSLAVYAAATSGHLGFPDTSDFDGWFFNPFAWQALFTLGLVLGILSQRGQGVAYQPAVFAAAAAYVVFAAAWRQLGFGDTVAPGLLPDWLGTLEKPALPLSRFLHVAALAYVVGHSALWVKLKRVPQTFLLTRMGRNSLPVFALGSQLSLAGWMLATWSGGGFAIEFSIAVAGVLAMSALALWLEGDLRVPGGILGRARGLEQLRARAKVGLIQMRFAVR